MEKDSIETPLYKTPLILDKDRFDDSALRGCVYGNLPSQPWSIKWVMGIYINNT